MRCMVWITKYAWLTLKHKAYVFRAGLRTRAPIWRLIIHDWSKFTPTELPYYARHFFGDQGDPEGFARAWLHHQNINPHHWEYWMPRTRHEREKSEGNVLPMPMPFVREMVADWLGATRAYTSQWDITEWFRRAEPRMVLHPVTRQRVYQVLKEIGFVRKEASA